MLFISCVCHAFAPCSHLLGCADLWLLFVMFIVFFFSFPCGILGQVWYLVVLFPDLRRLS